MPTPHNRWARIEGRIRGGLAPGPAPLILLACVAAKFIGSSSSLCCALRFLFYDEIKQLCLDSLMARHASLFVQTAAH